MAGERTPDISPSGTTSGSSDNDISLREHMQRQLDTQARYFERVISDMRDLLDQRFLAQQNAVDELKATTADRFSAVNEFRAQLNDQARTLMGRDESISRHERTTEMIAAMQARHDNDMRLLRERFESELTQLRERHVADIASANQRLDLGQGKSTGMDKAWGYLVAVIGVAAGIIGAILGLT